MGGPVTVGSGVCEHAQVVGDRGRGRPVQELSEALATAGIACSPTRKPGTGTPEQRGAQVFVHRCGAVGPFLPEALPLQNASMIVLADGLYGHRTEQRLTREVADSGR